MENNRLKNRICRMFRGSLIGSCSTRNVLEKSVFSPQTHNVYKHQILKEAASLSSSLSSSCNSSNNYNSSSNKTRRVLVTHDKYFASAGCKPRSCPETGRLAIDQYCIIPRHKLSDHHPHNHNNIIGQAAAGCPPFSPICPLNHHHYRHSHYYPMTYGAAKSSSNTKKKTKKKSSSSSKEKKMRNKNTHTINKRSTAAAAAGHNNNNDQYLSSTGGLFISSSSQDSAYLGDSLYWSSTSTHEEEEEEGEEDGDRNHKNNYYFYESSDTIMWFSSSSSDDSSSVLVPRGIRQQRRLRRKKRTNIAKGCDRKSNHDMGVGVIMDGIRVKDSFAVVKSSSDPYSDFRASMLEMIVEKQIFGAKDLEKLLLCFLSLNSTRHHSIIVEVFTDIWDTLFSS